MFPSQQVMRGGVSVLLCGGLHVHVDPVSLSWALLFGVGFSDCRDLNGNFITELAPTLFDKLTSLRELYVTLDAAMHAPFSS